jgi:hypothetical protein
MRCELERVPLRAAAHFLQRSVAPRPEKKMTRRAPGPGFSTGSRRATWSALLTMAMR